ncbi:hypothetical protein CCHL11_00652 [Colletotrichum chlorophyti]|uniref:Fe2OG dioxygenase domain-containing protein n=1 Tax=Colletotrichum chlorophyti TaxID=708187 RepID=A0A1Q8S514_9PEZI|nr:hypothetical protein CCHL11_00652 [Colletotrichum chlorophyti]
MAVPFGPPPIWANNRQALCDALNWFKSHESSLYTSEKVAKGFLLNAHPTVRDTVGSEVIITTLGGGRKRDDEGNMVRVAAGSKHLLTSCINAMEAMSPVGVVLGDKYPGLSLCTNRAFNVLDFFTITDVWTEKDTTGFEINKVRLEKTDRRTPSWWQPKSEVQQTARPRESPCHQFNCLKCHRSSKQMFSQGLTCLNSDCKEVFKFNQPVDIQQLSFASHRAAPLAWCLDCHKESKQVFSCGWACLNKGCNKFFSFPAGLKVDELAYSEEFLQERTSFEDPQEPLKPVLPDAATGGFIGTEKMMRDGIICPKCHGCSRRKYWKHWAYENSECDFILEAKPHPYPLEDVLAEEVQEKKKKAFSETKVMNEQIIKTTTEEVDGYRVEQYLLPDQLDPEIVLGSVTVFRASREVNSQPGGPDDIWNSLQQDTVEGNFDLQRSVAIHPGLPSEKYTRNFLQNWGAPYKFAVAVESKAFSEAPDAVLGSLSRMQRAGKAAIDIMNKGFNNEAPGRISMVRRCNSLCERCSIFNELLMLAYMEKDKISWHDDGEFDVDSTVATLSLGSPAMMHFKSQRRYAGCEDQALRLPLFHGDIVVMHGRRIHEAYLHRVDPKGKRRFALTCRQIVLERLDEKTRVEAREKSDIPPIRTRTGLSERISENANVTLKRQRDNEDDAEGDDSSVKATKKPRVTKARTAKRSNDEAESSDTRLTKVRQEKA